MNRSADTPPDDLIFRSLDACKSWLHRSGSLDFGLHLGNFATDTCIPTHISSLENILYHQSIPS
eukprot:11395656-Karenia_brevis.AAC.1